MANMSNRVAEISDPTHHTSLMTSLRQFVNTESFVDVQFICHGGHKVFAHKLMLISVSELLKKEALEGMEAGILLNGEQINFRYANDTTIFVDTTQGLKLLMNRLLTENPDSNEMITIHLPDINSKLLRIVVNFLYIGFMRLTNTEMDQFKLVLGLLDIELFQKPPEDKSASETKPDINKYPPSGNSSQSVVEPSPIVSTPRNVYNQLVLPTEFVSVPEDQSRVSSLPVENRLQQYITVQRNQLAVSGNPEEILIPLSAVPMISGTNSIGGTVPDLTARPQAVVPNQFSTFTSNVVNSPVMAAHASNNNVMQAPLVAASMSQLVAQTMPIQQNLVTQTETPPQHLIHYFPNCEAPKQMISNNLFPNATPDRSSSSTSQQATTGIKRRHNRSSATNDNINDVIDLSDDGVECNTGPKIANVYSINVSHKTCKHASKHRVNRPSSSLSEMPSNSSSSNSSNPQTNKSSSNSFNNEVIEIDQ